MTTMPKIGDAVVFYQVGFPPEDRDANKRAAVITDIKHNGRIDIAGPDGSWTSPNLHLLQDTDDQEDVPAGGFCVLVGSSEAARIAKQSPSAQPGFLKRLLG